MTDLIIHPDRPDEYLRAETVYVHNDDAQPRCEVVVASRYVSGDQIAQRKVGTAKIDFNPENPKHMALYEAMRAISLDGVEEVRASLQSARDARLNPQPVEDAVAKADSADKIVPEE